MSPPPGRVISFVHSRRSPSPAPRPRRVSEICSDSAPDQVAPPMSNQVIADGMMASAGINALNANRSGTDQDRVAPARHGIGKNMIGETSGIPVAPTGIIDNLFQQLLCLSTAACLRSHCIIWQLMLAGWTLISCCSAPCHTLPFVRFPLLAPRLRPRSLRSAWAPCLRCRHCGSWLAASPPRLPPHIPGALAGGASTVVLGFPSPYSCCGLRPVLCRFVSSFFLWGGCSRCMPPGSLAVALPFWLAAFRCNSSFFCACFRAAAGGRCPRAFL